MAPLPERGMAASRYLVTGPQSSHRRMVIAGPVVAIVSVLVALLTTDAAGLPLRDPDHVAGRRLVLVLCLVAVLIGLDVLVRAGSRSGALRPSRAAIESVRRERWTLPRGVAVGSALISFYATYLAYRNLKSVVPLIRPGDLFDRQLAEFDRSLFGGHDPATLLHELLGTGVQAHLMSGAYMLFFAFIPGTLAFALVFARNLQPGLFYVTAARPADRVPARPGGRRGAEHRRLFLIARVLLLHRCAGSASAGTRSAAADRGVGPARIDDRGHHLPGVALRR
jgi:hypothetical protein